MYLLMAKATDASRPCVRKSCDRGDAAEHVGEQHVENGAEDERTENADGHVALGISRFLGGGRDRIETDVGEEDDAGRAEDAKDSAIGVVNALRRDISRRRGNQRRVIGRIHESPSDADDEQHDAHLQDDDDAINEGRLFGSANKQTA